MGQLEDSDISGHRPGDSSSGPPKDWSRDGVALAEAVAGADHPQPLEYQLLVDEPVAYTSDSLVLRRMADILEVNRHRDVLGIGGGLVEGGSMGSVRPLLPLDLDGPEHTKYRRLLDPVFAPKVVATLEPTVRALTTKLIDGFLADGHADLYERLCVPLPSTIFLQIMGLPTEIAPQFLRFVEDVIRPQGATEQEAMAFARKAGEQTYVYIEAEMDRKEAAGDPGDDLLGRLMTAEVDGQRLTRLQILDISYLLIIAGLDTITSSLSCMLLWLAEHPSERRWILEDPDARWGPAIEELLRWFTPAPMAPRYATKDLVVNGVTVLAGTKIVGITSAANLDPVAFPEPLQVDLTRSPNRHIAFASGFHRCLGSHLARLELRVALDEIHRRIPDYEVADGETPVRDNTVVRRVTYLPVAWRIPGE